MYIGRQGGVVRGELTALCRDGCWDVMGLKGSTSGSEANTESTIRLVISGMVLPDWKTDIDPGKIGVVETRKSKRSLRLRSLSHGPNVKSENVRKM